jgi:cytoskeletal protein CcmA (bactofilin family)
MWRKRIKAKRLKTAKIDTLIGRKTTILGNIRFKGGLHVDGQVKGDVAAVDQDRSLLSLSESGAIEGEVHAPHAILNGTVIGDVHVDHHVELKPRARITGNVYYGVITLAPGANVNGNLIPDVGEEGHPLLPHRDPPAAETCDPSHDLAESSPDA